MNGSPWTPEQIALLRALYPHRPTRDVAKVCGHTLTSTYGRAYALGLTKTAEFRASPESGIMVKGTTRGAPYRFQKGLIPWNAGLRRPGYAPGRMRETQFKRGQVSRRWDPERYHVGALRLNADGYVDMKMHDGHRPWRRFHLVLWEDAHGPVPRGHAVVFKDRDRLNIELDNLELVSRAELCRRNSIHNLPKPLKSAINLLGQLKRRIREKQDRGSAQSPVRHAGGAA